MTSPTTLLVVVHRGLPAYDGAAWAAEQVLAAAGLYGPSDDHLGPGDEVLLGDVPRGLEDALQAIRSRHATVATFRRDQHVWENDAPTDARWRTRLRRDVQNVDGPIARPMAQAAWLQDRKAKGSTRVLLLAPRVDTADVEYATARAIFLGQPDCAELVYPAFLREGAPDWSLRDVPHGFAPYADDDLVVLDTETTGRSRDADVLDLALIRVDRAGAVLKDVFSSRIQPRPTTYVDPEAAAVNGYTRAGWRDAPTQAEAWAAARPVLDGATCIVHNVAFDQPKVEAGLARAGLRAAVPAWYCTMKAAGRWLRPRGLQSKSLAAVAAFFGIPHADAHRALADAATTWQVYLRLVEVAAAGDGE